MIACLYNDSGLVTAYIEWQVVDAIGRTKENGEYIYIADLWIHKWYRFKGVIRQLTKLIDSDPRSHSAHSVYWLNFKHKERQTPTYSKDKLIKKGIPRGIK